MALWVFLTGVCYYLSTRIAWALCFPDSKVSLFFPPHAVLISILLLVPTKHWWAYTLASICSHFVATQQAHWPPLYALHCEVFDAVQNVSAAAGIRMFVKSPFHQITLREAIIFILIAVVIVPFGTAFWGAAFTVSNHFGTHYWVEWRNLGISNAVTAIILVPAILVGAHQISARRINVTPARFLEAAILGVSILTAGFLAFDRSSAGSNASPVLLYTPIPLLIWAALRFGLGGVSAAMLAVTFQAIWGTMHVRGPFLTQAPAENALALQMFLLVMAIPLMLLAVMVKEETLSKNALRESEERTLLASEAAQLGMWMWDIPNSKMWLSDKLRELLEFSAGTEVSYENFLTRVHEADRTYVDQAFQRALAERGRYHCEYRVLRPDGTPRWMSDTGHVRGDSTGAPALLLGVSMDITERRRSEEELERLSYSMVHDLRAPLRAIINFGDLIKVEGENRLSQAQQGYLDRMRTASVRMDHLICDMLKYSSLLHTELPLSPVSVPELLREMIAQNPRFHLTEGHIEIEAPMPLVRANDTVLAQCLSALMDNALRYCRPGVAPEIRIRGESLEGWARISVTDNGMGMPREFQERVFGIFQKGTNSTEGLGIGLALVRVAVRQMGGRVGFTSEEGTGSRFWIDLRPAERQG